MTGRILLTLVASLSQVATEDSYRVPDFRLGKIAKLTVTVKSASNGQETGEECNEFQMTSGKAAYFFRHAKVIARTPYFHDFIYSSCFSDGILRFSDGTEAKWSISRGGTGFLLPRSGRFKEQSIYLYCRRCEP